MHFFKYIFFMLFTLPLFADHSDPQKISLQLKWKYTYQFAGFYMAKEKGYYKEAGLDVDIREIKNGVDILKDVLAGRSTYGLSDSALILDRLRGGDVIALKAIFQKSPIALMSLKSSGINKIEDLIGKKIMMPKLTSQNASIMAMLKSSGITSKTSDIIPMRFNINDLIEQKTDAFSVYISNQPYLLKEKGIGYNLFSPHDYGYNFYGDILYTLKKRGDGTPKKG